MYAGFARPTALIFLRKRMWRHSHLYIIIWWQKLIVFFYFLELDPREGVPWYYVIILAWDNIGESFCYLTDENEWKVFRLDFVILRLVHTV